MENRSTRPTLADLWRRSLDRLERLGVEDAAIEARSLAIAEFTRRSTAEAAPRGGSASSRRGGRSRRAGRCPLDLATC